MHLAHWFDPIDRFDCSAHENATAFVERSHLSVNPNYYALSGPELLRTTVVQVSPLGNLGGVSQLVAFAFLKLGARPVLKISSIAWAFVGA